jgi:signal transduction histidine kinase
VINHTDTLAAAAGADASGSDVVEQLSIEIPQAGLDDRAAPARRPRAHRRAADVAAAAVEASRARFVEVADEARRRLARDLHDGAQQRLVLAALTLRRAAAQARGTGAEPLVAEAFDQLQQGLAELRELARGIHPAVLSDRGLAPALEGLVAGAPVPVELRVTPRRVPPVLESAIYFTVAEALTNALKYAAATRVTVEVDVENGGIVAEIADDGVGGARPRAGSGLRGLADRLQALGGTLTVQSRRGRGTVVHARVPLPSNAVPAGARPAVIVE